MPENFIQWCFFGFFLFGAIGGWWALFETVRLKLLDMRDSKTVTDDDLSPPQRNVIEIRTRQNLPVYKPRKLNKEISNE
jgi:hypothetical protein